MFFANKKGWQVALWLMVFTIMIAQPGNLFAQTLNNNRSRTIYVDQDTLIIDTLSIIPGSGKIDWSTTSFTQGQVSFDYLKGSIIRADSETKDSISIKYKVFPLSFSKTYYKKSTSLILPSNIITSNTLPSFKSSDQNQSNLLGISGLNRSGSISRGISFGNNQDLSVNSNLNLQLSGTLKNDIQVLASITDQNIPIQPDGNTQQIQDFDQVYIELFNSKFRLKAGDLLLKPTDSYFLKYLKKGQGISYTSFFDLNPSKQDSLSRKLQVGAAAAASRGKFARNTVAVIEGNQGPYLLTGKDNEQFIVIISGTERVFMDGKLLTRGQDNDYVIDYNAAELTFTPQIITANSRVVVEFQYTDKNYARYLLQSNNSYQSKNLELNFNFFSEQDLKNQPLQQELTDSNKFFLKNLGDNLQDAVVDRIDSIGYSEDYPMYKLIDSVGYDSVFIYSTNKDSATYRLSFSQVGYGNGNYVSDGYSTVGRIFKWVAPNSDGTLNGNYAPVVLLVTPKKRLAAILGGTYKVGNNTSINFEGGFTNNDKNTFSDFDKEDNQGYSGKLQLEHNISLSKKTNWGLKLTGNSEHISKYFNPIERFREVEFNRNWNTPVQLINDYQWINGAGVELSKQNLGNINYNLSSFVHGNQFEGYRNQLGTSIGYDGGKLEFDGSLVNTEGEEFSSSFLRHRSHLTKNIKYVSLHYKDEHEQNLFTDSSNNLSTNSYRFYNWEVSLSSLDSSKQQFSVFYGERLDRKPLSEQLTKTSFARNYGLEFSVFNKSNNKLKGRAMQRNFIVLDENLTEIKPENTLTGRIEYLFRLFDNAIFSSTFYEAGSGLERKKEFQYKKVADGQGVYVWNDKNNDGKENIELGEFELPRDGEPANYIKVFFPTNEFIKAFSNKFSETINLKTPKNWRTGGKVKKFGSKFSEQISYQVGRKVTENNNLDAFNPFLNKATDTTLVSLNSSIRNNLYFNRINPVYNIFHTYNESESKTLLTTGFESRKNKFNELSGRWNFHTLFSLNTSGKMGIKENLSSLEGRNYRINYRSVNSQVSYQPGTYLRLSLSAKYEEKRNHPDYGNEISFTRDFGFECRYNSLEKGSFTLQFNFVDISFNGENNTTQSYEMLEALQVGNNYTWSLHFQRNLGKNLQLDLQYHGRKSISVKTIHNGGMSLRALF